MRMFRMMAGTMLILGAGATAAQPPAQAARNCLSGPQAEAVFLALAPAAIKVAGVTCANALPPGAMLRQTDGPFLAKMQAASDGAWPTAIDAVRRLAGPDLAPLLESEVMRPMLGGLIAPLIVADLKPQDCPKVERITTLLSPLPPRNIAALGITILQYAQDDARRRGKTAKVPLCPANP